MNVLKLILAILGILVAIVGVVLLISGNLIAGIVFLAAGLALIQNGKEELTALLGKISRNASPQKIKRTAIIAVVVILVAVLFGNSFYELNEDEYAVITTLGKPSVVDTSGLKFKIPLIQQKQIVSKATKGIAIGYVPETDEVIPSESVMITVDYNFVNVDFYVEYRVTDPVKFLYNSQDPVGILKMLCQSYIRDTIGLYEVDDVITTGKSEIQSIIKEKILNRLEMEDLGITLVNITIQDAEPPTTEVQEAFKAVETAKQDADTATNNANKYKNEVLPAAEADADEILQQAEAYKAARINEAEGQASRFAQLYEEYSKFPEITRQRLFYEMIAKIFPDMKIVILGEDGDVSTVLPLDDFAGAEDVVKGAE